MVRSGQSHPFHCWILFSQVGIGPEHRHRAASSRRECQKVTKAVILSDSVKDVTFFRFRQEWSRMALIHTRPDPPYHPFHCWSTRIPPLAEWIPAAKVDSQCVCTGVEDILAIPAKVVILRYSSRARVKNPGIGLIPQQSVPSVIKGTFYLVTPDLYPIPSFLFITRARRTAAEERQLWTTLTRFSDSCGKESGGL